MAEEFVNANLILPGTYIRVRSEGLIGVAGISTGNIGVVGTASQGAGVTHNLSSADEAQAAGTIGRAPTEPRRVGVVVDRHAHACERRQVEGPPARGGEVEVEQGDGPAGPEHDVLEADVVVADHRLACGIGQLPAPGQIGGVDLFAGVVQLTDQGHHRPEGLVGLGPRRVGRGRNLARDEPQSLAAVGVTPDYVRDMRRAGVELTNSDDAQSLRALGVTPRFVQRLAKAGYSGLTVEQLQRLGASGLTEDFVREMSKYRSR